MYDTFHLISTNNVTIRNVSILLKAQYTCASRHSLRERVRKRIKDGEITANE